MSKKQTKTREQKLIEKIQDYLAWYGDLKECERKCPYLFLYARMDKLKRFILDNIKVLNKDMQKEVKNYLKQKIKGDEK